MARFSSGAARPLSTLLGARQRRFVSYLWVTVGAGLDGVERWIVLHLTFVSNVIVESILDGRHDPERDTLEQLMRPFSATWGEQLQRLLPTASRQERQSGLVRIAPGAELRQASY